MISTGSLNRYILSNVIEEYLKNKKCHNYCYYIKNI